MNDKLFFLILGKLSQYFTKQIDSAKNFFDIFSIYFSDISYNSVSCIFHRELFDMHPMLNIAVRAARTAGNLIARNLGQNTLSVEEKRKDDLVTDIDRECERTISSMLLKSYRDHAVLGEEGGLQGNPDSPYKWIIDPIDGTTNFVKGVPHCAVSIALQHENRTIVGVVFDPITNEMFTASRGDGAHLNGQRIRVSNKQTLDGTVICTAVPVRYRERMSAYLELFARLVDQCADIRRTGCASLDLCYVACGRFDGYLEQGLKPWDFAAGELIVREAGGISSDFMGGPNFATRGNIVAGNPYIVKNLVAKVCDGPNLPGILR